MRSQEGYTIIEVILVLAIIGILVGMAAPAFSKTLQSTYLANSAQELVSDIRGAQSDAFTRGSPYEIRFSPPAGYSIYQQGSATPDKSLTLENGIGILSVSGISGNVLVFDAFGKPGISAVATVTLRNRLGAQKTIEITPVTGRARVVP